MLRTHSSFEGLLCNPVMKMKFFSAFLFNGAPVEWNWHGKTEVLGEKPVPVPLCPPQIPHGPTRDWTPASAVRGRRLTAWAMARPTYDSYSRGKQIPCPSGTRWFFSQKRLLLDPANSVEIVASIQLTRNHFNTIKVQVFRDETLSLSER
jgi:hypothetical protein